MTDHSVVSTCLPASALLGTGLPIAGLPAAALPVTGLSGLGAAAVREHRNERPTKALEAVAGEAMVYGFAATGAGTQQTTQHHHTMWAFRGLEPWSDPV
ncbi:hypothetical protein BU197_00465 [Streptomyces sp. CBMA291]|nr:MULTISPECIES: hypothetical protein [unclassified Streptomyces]MBD0706948.1 hypothetical protein [Streptomyces sp. CBMA291]MBD0716601.1 hypothetical protein [Streptomyces sp. CBMA370]